MQYLIAFCSGLEAASDVISDADIGQVAKNVSVKFGDSSSNFFFEIYDCLTLLQTNDDAGLCGHHIRTQRFALKVFATY